MKWREWEIISSGLRFIWRLLIFSFLPRKPLVLQLWAGIYLHQRRNVLRLGGKFSVTSIKCYRAVDLIDNLVHCRGISLKFWWPKIYIKILKAQRCVSSGRNSTSVKILDVNKANVAKQFHVFFIFRIRFIHVNVGIFT